MGKRVLISGASVAGPALAFWLGRAGYDVTVVERAPKLREGGYAVDFRGEAHLGVLRRMGVLEALRDLETGGGAMRFVDPKNRTQMFLPTEFAGGELEVRRADLSRVLYEAGRDSARYLFGDTVRSLTQHADRVDVTFENAAPESFDLVVGADGIHSNVRRLAFPGQEFERDLGYYIASWDTPGIETCSTETVCCNVPGRMIGIQPPGRDGTPPSALALFASKPLPVGRRDVSRQKEIIRQTFTGMGWHAPKLLDALEATDDLYFNTISRAKVPHWSVGRVVLLGDAAGGVSIGGMGTGSAIVGAYVLAGELLASPDDHAAAFSRYQSRVEPYAAEGANNGESSGKFLAPASRLGLTLRNAMFNFPPIKKWMINLAQESGAAIDLPEYQRLANA